MPQIIFWFSGLAWIAAFTFALAFIGFCIEMKSAINQSPFPIWKGILSFAILISALLAWWGSAVQEKAQSPRKLTLSQQEKLISILSPVEKSNMNVIVFHNAAQSEDEDYAKQWIEVFEKSGWKVEKNWGFTSARGLVIQVKNINTKGAGNIQQAIASIDLKSEAQLDESISENTIKLIVGSKK